MQLNQVGPEKVIAPTDKVLDPYISQIEQWIKQDNLKLSPNSGTTGSRALSGSLHLPASLRQ